MNTNAIREHIANLRKESSTNISQKELSDLLFLLDIVEKYQIDKHIIRGIISLPDSQTGYSEHRIINDCESDNPENWLELKIEMNVSDYLPGI